MLRELGGRRGVEKFVHYSITAGKGPKCIDVVWAGSASYLIVKNVGIWHFYSSAMRLSESEATSPS